MQKSGGRPYRSMFWPVVMIGIGVVWLLANFRMIPAVNLEWLLSLWPLLLIGIGLDMLIGRGSPILGALIALILVGGVIALVLAGPALGVRLPTSEVKVERFEAALDKASSASVTINTSSAPVEIHSLTGSDRLIDAEIGHTGEMDFRVSGDTQKEVFLAQRGTVGLRLDFMNNALLRWDIGLSDALPLDLNVDSGSGRVNLNLVGLQLSDLQVDSGSGAVTVNLPETAESYDAEIDSGSGSVEVRLPSDTTLTLRINSGSGAVRIDMPVGAALRLEVESSGSGAVNYPSRMERVSGGDDNDEGIWETPGFDQAQRKITIIAENLGSGSFRVE